MPVRVLLEMFESMGRIWAQMLISMNCFHVCLCGLFLGLFHHRSLFCLSQPGIMPLTMADLLSSVSKTGIKCRHEFCWDCLKDYKEIRKAGNDKHAPTCPFHTNNIRD